MAAAGLSLVLALSGMGCSSAHYTPPESGPTATLRVASSCLVTPARFYARINGQRTESYGCNQTATWRVAPGLVVLEIQVEEEQFRVDPLAIDLEVSAGDCASFLLRQRDGYDLEFFGVGPCGAE